jgi:branched-chain amino acid transport system substrate-binding protein
MNRLVLLTVSILLFANSFGWAADPVRLGFIFILSGRGGNHGMVAKQGATTAVDEINASGGILGRKIEAIFEDSEGNAKKGAEVAKKLILQDRVDAIIGVISSGVAPAVADVAAEHRTPLLITTALNPVITGEKCNPYTFRVTASSGQLMKTAAIVATKTSVSKWTTIGPDYALGTQS